MSRILATRAGAVEETGASVPRAVVSFLSLAGAVASVALVFAASARAAPAPGWAIPPEGRDTALLSLKRLWLRNPSAVEPAIELGTLLLFSGRREEALRTLLLAHASSSAPGGRSRLEGRVRVLSRSFMTADGARSYQAGVNALLAGDLLPALARFDAVVASEDRVLDAVVRKGQTEALLGLLDSAAETLRLARQMNPFEPEIRAWLGYALLSRGERDEGVREMRDAWTMADPAQRARAHWKAWMARANASVSRSGAARTSAHWPILLPGARLVESSGWSLWAIGGGEPDQARATKRFLNLFPNGYRRLVGASGLDLEWWEPALLGDGDADVTSPETHPGLSR